MCCRLPPSVCVCEPVLTLSVSGKMVAASSGTNLLGVGGVMERHGMGSAIASTPTSVMLEELKESGVELPNDAQLTTLSQRMNEWLEAMRSLEGREKAQSWYNLFRELDEDGDGNVTFDELSDVVRHKLKRGVKHMSEDALKALWCALDVDQSNSISQLEMAAFLKRGAPSHAAISRPKPAAKQHTSANLVGALERHGMGSAIASTPTSVMLEELKESGVELPNDAQLTTLSQRMNEWLDNLRHAEGRERAVSWFNLFKELDEDGDSMVTFDELESVVRKKLRKGSAKMSDNALKALWCALDVDCSNAIQKDEMAAFLKRGAPAIHKVEKRESAADVLAKQHTSANLLGAGGVLERHGMGSAIASTPTKDMKKELEAAGVVLPSAAEQIALSKQFNMWLKHAREEGNKSTHSWYNLFKEVDVDGSGFITYDEFRRVVRQKLRVKPIVMSDQALKALWVVLDVDSSDSIMPDEFARFLKGRVPGIGGSLTRAKSADALGKLVGGKRQASPRRRSYEELEQIRIRAEMDADRPRREEELKQIARDSAMRLGKLRGEMIAYEDERRRRMQHEQLDCAYKRELLSRMRRNMVRSPIPPQGSEPIIRLGSARILPLYQSERLVVHMEQQGFKRPWPGRKPYTPRTPSTLLLEQVGRAETLLSPSWFANSGGGAPSSRAITPSGRMAAAGGSRGGGRATPKLPVPTAIDRELKAVRANAYAPRL